MRQRLVSHKLSFEKGFISFQHHIWVQMSLHWTHLMFTFPSCWCTLTDASFLHSCTSSRPPSWRLIRSMEVLGQSSMQVGQFLSHLELQCLPQPGQTSDQCQIIPQNNCSRAVSAPKSLNTSRNHKWKAFTTVSLCTAFLCLSSILKVPAVCLCVLMYSAAWWLSKRENSFRAHWRLLTKWPANQEVLTVNPTLAHHLANYPRVADWWV